MNCLGGWTKMCREMKLNECCHRDLADMVGMSASALDVLTSLLAFWRSAISALLTVPALIETPAAKAGRALVARHWTSRSMPLNALTPAASSFFCACFVSLRAGSLSLVRVNWTPSF